MKVSSVIFKWKKYDCSKSDRLESAQNSESNTCKQTESPKEPPGLCTVMKAPACSECYAIRRTDVEENVNMNFRTAG